MLKWCHMLKIWLCSILLHTNDIVLSFYPWFSISTYGMRWEGVVNERLWQLYLLKVVIFPIAPLLLYSVTWIRTYFLCISTKHFPFYQYIKFQFSLMRVTHLHNSVYFANYCLQETWTSRCVIFRSLCGY